MAFSINTNLGALQAYLALENINAKTQQAQLRLSTGKKINSVADDTSGYRVGKQLEAQTIVQNSQLNNITSAKNYLATAEASLNQINDLLTQISAKHADAEDPTKNKASIAKDINSLATEIDTILKNTNFNGKNLLAQSDGSALTSNDVFDVGGTMTMDFASNSYLNVSALETALNGGTVTVPDQGVMEYDGSLTVNASSAYTLPQGTSKLTATFADGSSTQLDVSTTGASTIGDVINNLTSAINSANPGYTINWIGPPSSEGAQVWSTGSYITSLKTTSGSDIASLLGITRNSTPTTTTVGGLLDSNADTAIATAGNLTSVSNNVKSALGRIGTLSQVLDVKTDVLTSEITNNTASVSRLFDADTASEQLKVTKGTIQEQVGTSMLSQLNSAPQQLLALFH